MPVFVGEGLLVLWLGTVRGRLAFALERGVAGMIGIALYVYALALHPLIAFVAGRPLQAAEVVGIAPDPTAIATLGLLTLAPRRAGTVLLIILPIIWCLASALTLRTMGASEGWIPLTAAALAALAQAWPRRNGFERRSSLKRGRIFPGRNRKYRRRRCRAGGGSSTPARIVVAIDPR